MRADASEVEKSSKAGAGPDHGARAAKRRKTRLRSLALEPLETRTLMSTLPPVTTTSRTPVSNATTGNSDAPSIAIDPNDPQKMVAVWVHNDPGNPLAPGSTTPTTAFVEAAYSSNGGSAWTQISRFFLADRSGPGYAMVTDPSVAFDAHDNFYITDLSHAVDYSSGQLNLERFKFDNTGVSPPADVVVTQWAAAAGAAYKPVLAVDANQTSYPDPNNLLYTQADPESDLVSGGNHYGAVYLTWTTNANASTPTNSRTVLAGSFDGGQTFFVTPISGGGSDQASAPTLAISQGRPADTAGHGAGDPGVTGGQVTVVWDDLGNLDNGLDRLMANLGTFVPKATFTNNTTTPINEATNTTATPPVPVPQTTSVPINVNESDPNFVLGKLTARVALTHGDLSEISVVLVPPTNSGLPSITLLNNGVTAAGVPIAPVQGATGQNLGVDSLGNPTGTVFDDIAGQSIAGNKGGQASVGTFRPEVGSLASLYGAGASQVNGTWNLVVTDFRPDASPGPQAVNLVSLSLTGESVTAGNEKEIGTTSVRGVVNGGIFPNAATQAASPSGYGPAPSLASDNTLGQSSPYSGRLYLAYVDRGTSGANPVDNTDIESIYSDDGGKTWSGPVKVNDDNSTTDGFSEAGVNSGRPQFAPKAAVDPATGTVFVAYLDTRNDAARARTAYYINTSIDGGNSFGPGAYANASKTAVDAITTNTVVLGPVPDNQSAGNTTTLDKTFGFGDHQGLAVFNGNVYPVWSSNSNGGNDGNQGLRIVLGHSQTANGPRVVSGTSGPVGESISGLNSARNTAGDGGPEVSAIQVTFDRPVNPAGGPTTFDASNVQFTYTDVNGGVHPLGSLPGTVKGIVTNPNDPSQNGHFGYKTFEVDLTTPLTQVGAYSYTITGSAGKPISTGVQYFTGSGFQLSEPYSQGSFTIPTPSATDSLPLIVSGPHVLNTSGGVVVQNLKPGATDNEVLNNTVSYVDVTFDRDMNTGAANFTPADVIRVDGPAGAVSGPFTVTPLNARTFRVEFPTQSLSGTYSITLASSITDAKGDPLDTNLNAGLYQVRGVNPYATATPHTYRATDTPIPIPPGVANPPSPPTPSFASSFINVPDNFIVQDASVQLDIAYPNDPDLKVSLVGPDGTTFVLINHLGAPGSSNFSGTVIGDTSGSSTTLDQGAAPFFGSFLPQAGAGSLGVTFGSGAYKSQGKWQLLIENDGSGNAGTLNSWSLTLSSKLPTGIGSTGLGEPVADQVTAHFRIFVDDPTNPLTSTTWTSVGPSPVVNSNNGAVMSGRIGAIAVDPSDPSGNTVYAGGASGGVWKTTNFMTPDANGPTWTPLTDFGPTAGINVGTITVIPQGNDPTKSIVLVGLGDPDVGKKGYGFLRSTDGGATFELLDSMNNTGAFGSRDHTFSANDTVVNKIAFDPVLNSTKQHNVYAALGGAGASSGLWRSVDTGTTWTKISNASLGAATDVTLDPVSGQGVAGGNLQILYASFPGSGVYSSPNQGTSLFLMSGTTGDPLIRDIVNGTVAVNAGPAPTGVPGGKILLAKPSVLNSSDPSNPGVLDKLYEGWLYALVANPGGFDGLYLTKDYGQNWTKVALPAVNNGFGVYPSNNETLANANNYGAGATAGGVSFAIDPTNPNIVYIGGGNGGDQPGFLRVDTTAVFDAHNFVGFDDNRPDGGQLQVNTTGGVALSDPVNHPSAYLVDPVSGIPNPVAYLNLIRDPRNPFAVNSTLQTDYISSSSGFTNSGANARLFTYYSTSQFNPNSAAFNKSGGQHRLVTFVDPQTGHARLIFGDNQGIFTGVDDNGSLIGGVGTLSGPLGSRNGNLSITQFFYGAVQPSAHNSATNNPMSVLFYGGVADVGAPASQDVLNTGNLTWSGPGGSSSVVQTDPTGSGTVYRTVFQKGTNFFTVNDVGRTFGLLQGPSGSNFLGAPSTFNNGATVFGNFTVNSVNGNQILISDRNGTIFRTEDQGKNWHAISDPFGSYAPAVAFGAPDPNAPNGIGNLDNFIYAGTLDGRAFVSQTGGGGGAGNSTYTDISRGLDGSTVQQIITDPVRGSHDAYAVTLGGLDTVNYAGPVPGPADPTVGNIPSGGLTESFTVPAPTNEKLSDLSVNLNITLPPQAPKNQPIGTDADLSATLTAPDGTVFTLFSGVGGTSQAGFINTVFNDSGALPINSNVMPNPPTAPFTGTYQIQDGAILVHMGATPGPLNQKNIEGKWTLNITTDGQPVVARLNSWSVDFSAQGGVYYMPDSTGQGTTNQGATWLNVTNDLFQKTTPSYGNAAEPTQHLFDLTSIQADWRYALPYAAPLLPGASVSPHPVLYVSGEGGVYRTLDDGQTWTNFPNQAIDNAPVEGGYLPNLRVANLTQATGNINPNTGRAVYQSGDPNILVASTYGRGQFEIELAPTVIPNTAASPNIITLDPTSLFKTSTTGVAVTLSTSPVIDGLSEETVFGTVATVSLVDLTDPKNPQPVPLTGTVTTDANGKYQLHVNNYFAGKPSGTYTFGVQATDQKGAKGNVALFTFVYDTATPAPTNITLDPTTDSGTFNGDEYTNFNNSTAANSPLLDVSGILPGATVYLLRAAEVGGVVGAFTLVNTGVNTGTTTGVVKVADTNAGNGVIPDTPVNALIDTAPPQPNQYVYQAYQIDVLNLQGPNDTPGLNVIVDTASPTAPSGVKLDPASDSGTSSTDGYTNFNNATPAKAPVFDVTGIEPHATVELIRDTIDPKTGQPSGNPIVVNTITNVTPTGANNLVQIADTNAGKGAIPDNPVGTPGDTAPPVGTPAYTYTAIQLDLAGNVSKPSVTFGNRGAIVLDGTDSDLHGDSFGPGKTNENGWKYMQKVLEAIQPNTTDGQKVLVALGTQDSGGSFGYAGQAIESAFNQSTLPGLGWTIVHVSGTANMDAYLSGKPANAVDTNDKAAGTITLAQTGLMYITTANETGDDLIDADLTMIDTHGLDIKAYLNSGGGLYTQCETNSDPSVKGYGWLSSLFPGINYTSLGSGGEFPANVQLTPAGTAIFPGLTPADLSTGPVHGYFGGTIPAALATVFTFDESTSKATQPLGLSSVGGGGSVSSGNQVIIDTTPPVTPGFSLEAASDTGTYGNDLVTNRNNNPSPANAPVFDAANVEPNAIVQLFRNGVLVNKVTEGTTGGTLAIADINSPTNGTIPDGTYTYTVMQTDLAGNVGGTATLTVVINATPPPAPSPFQLDPASDTGTFNNDGITKDNNGSYPAPVFDVNGVVNRATVNLYRAPVVGGVTGAPVLVNSLADTKGGSLTIADTNAGAGTIPDGTYVYTAQQVDLAGNSGPISRSVTVTIDTDGPQPAPIPAPSLEARSDTGTFNNDQITQDDNSATYPAPVFDVGAASFAVEAGATVQLFRAPVVGGVTGTAVLVKTITNSAGGIVAIADTNAGAGVIPDGTYLYTVQLTDLAGVSGTRSAGQKVTILTSPPALPQPFRLDAGSDTGTSNSDGITQITQGTQPVFDAGGVVRGGTVNLYRAPVDNNGNVGAAALVHTLQNTSGGTVKISDPTSPADGQYVYTVQQLDLAGDASPVGGAIPVIYDNAQPTTTPALTLDPASDTGAKGDNTTSNTSPKFDVNVTATGLEANSSLTLVRDGAPVAHSPYNLSTGVATIQDPGPVTFGVHNYQTFLTDLAGNVGALSAPTQITFASDPAGSLTLDPASDSGAKGDNITNVTSPTFDVVATSPNVTLQLYRDGKLVATKPTGGGGNESITDKGPLSNGTYTYTTRQLDALNNLSPSSAPLVVTVDTSIPVALTGFKLDPASDSGPKGDNLTNVNKPAFDASGVVAGATVDLVRDGVVVASLILPSAGTVMITDPGPVAGTHNYSVQQVSIAGNSSPMSAVTSVTINTTVPASPLVTLDPRSDTGVKGDNVTAVVAPTFDLSGVAAGSTLQLFRNGLLIQTVPNATAGTDQVQDTGPLIDGQYTYTAVQTNVAGTASAAGTPLIVTINTTPPLVPTSPSLGLDPSADSGIVGDGVTNSRLPVIAGNADPNVSIIVYDGNGKVVGRTTADASGNFSVAVPTALADGVYSYQATATDKNNKVSPLSSPALSVRVVTVPGDFSGAGKTQLSVFRRISPETIDWIVQNYGPINFDQFGVGNQDVPLSGDYEGDGRTDPLLYRPSTGQWFVQASSNGFKSQALTTFGAGVGDIPVPGDYLGTGKFQEAIFKPGSGAFYVLGMTKPTTVVTGESGDIPVPGNYDNTGKDEFAVYNPGKGVWTVLGPNGTHTIAFGGGNGDVPVPGTYYASATNQSASVAVWKPTTGQYVIQTPGGNARVIQFSPGDIPAPGDYDGIGVTEAAVYRPSTLQWFVVGPNESTPRLLASFGGSKDIPTLAPYAYRALPGTPGGIKAFGTPTGSLDIGSTAQAFVTTATAVTAVAPPAQPASVVAPPAAPATRNRPNQPLLSAAVFRHEQAVSRHHMSVIDKALETLTRGFTRRHHARQS